MYVDNLITGAISVTEAISIYSDPKKIFREASMNLREWISNDKVVDTFIPESEVVSVQQIFLVTCGMLIQIL